MLTEEHPTTASSQNRKSSAMVLTEELPNHPSSLAFTFTPFLREIGASELSPYVHPRPISFQNDAEKQSWAKSIIEEDVNARDTFGVWWSTPKQNKKSWVAIVSSWAQNWVGDPNWDARPWHIWGIAVIAAPQGRGKHVVIWDCDPRDQIKDKRPRRVHELMLSIQTNLIRFIGGNHNGKRRAQIKSIYYNTDTSKSEQAKCLQHTMQWALDMARHGDLPFNEETDELGHPIDARVRHCVKVPT